MTTCSCCGDVFSTQTLKESRGGMAMVTGGGSWTWDRLCRNCKVAITTAINMVTWERRNKDGLAVAKEGVGNGDPTTEVT
jgi:hypothetical protein